jgi:hypothetical protein
MLRPSTSSPETLEIASVAYADDNVTVTITGVFQMLGRTSKTGRGNVVHCHGPFG